MTSAIGMAKGMNDVQAWIHDVVQDDGEEDQALSFSPDSFPLQGVGGFRSLRARPLYTAAPAEILLAYENMIADHGRLQQQLAAAREALQAAEARAAKAEQVSDMEWNRAENLAEDIEAYHMAMDGLGLAHRVDDIGRSLSMYGRAVVSMTVFATQQRQALINTAAELVQGIPAGSPQPTKANATLQRDRQP